MKKNILLALFLLIGFNIYAQSEASTWYFGYNSGIKFDLASNSITTLTDGNLNTFEVAQPFRMNSAIYFSIPMVQPFGIETTTS